MARLKSKPDMMFWGPVLRAGRFAEVCDTLEKLTEKNRQHTYILGYAYWRLGQPYKAMAHWWKLAHKVEKPLLEDLHALSGYVQTAATTHHPDWEAFSLPELKSQFLCLRRLAPEAAVTYQLRYHLYQKLWWTGAFQELKRFTQSDPGLSQGERLVWLAKLQLRARQPLQGLPISFVDTYVSAVTTFIKQNGGRLDAANFSNYLLELQDWLLDARTGLNDAKVGILTRYARQGFAILEKLVQHPLMQTEELLLTPAYLGKMDALDPVRLRYQAALREPGTDPALHDIYSSHHVWEDLKAGAFLDHANGIQTRVHFVPVNGRPDPFQTLGIAPESTKAEVMAVMMKLIREQPHNMADWRRAQSEIFDPERVQRIHFFQHPPRRRVFLESTASHAMTIPSISLPYRGPKEFAPNA